jgi:hypothetical protein
MAQLSEQAEILDPFLEATNFSPGEKCVTISYVLPSVLSFRTQLHEWTTKAKYCQPVVKALLTSLFDRFSDLFNRTTSPSIRRSLLSDDHFGSDVYVIATVLDPTFRMQ